MRRPDRKEDAKNLSLISVSGVIAFIVTAALIYAHNNMDRAPIPIPIPARVAVPLAELGPVSGSTRLYGTVVTRRGAKLTGLIRWDRNEGSWADVLDAEKMRDGGRVTQAGIRFGHVHRIEPLNGSEALFTLKSGEQLRMGARATDLGNGLRAFLIDVPGRGTEELQWRDLELVEFEPAPEDLRPSDARFYGTLTTRSGLEFSGYIGWDVDEIFTTDILDGESEGVDREIPFGSIEAIERAGSGGARVTLLDGSTMVLRGSNDVNSSISGISVSDPTLGEVKLGWEEFDHVQFHSAEVEPGWGFFDGGHPIVGTVVTEAGQEYSGEIAWDNDETASWEMLNGEMDGVELQVEFGNISGIRKTSRGALVELKDGRSFELDGSNDVDNGNRGITVRAGGEAHEIEWDEFSELRLADG